jgi:acetoin utilization deacetylase AcuC-like enzyme
MIIYDKSQKFNLADYGIEIPVYDTRASKTFETLTSHARLTHRMDALHVDSIDEALLHEDILRVHSRHYTERLFSDVLEQEIIKTYDLIDSNGRFHRYNPAKATMKLTELFDAVVRKTAGTVQCCRLALAHGFCFHFSGGFHHARYDTGSGFCLLNDIVIAARKLQSENKVKRVWVIDVDAHKGDGTAALTQNDETIMTLSIHMACGWPLDGEPYDAHGRLNPPFLPSDIDIPIARGEDALYVDRLCQGLESLDTTARPDLAIVVCGADPYEKDELPSTADLRLTLAQLLERDRLVYTFLKDRNIPMAFLMAGGYGNHSWRVYTQFLKWAL